MADSHMIRIVLSVMRAAVLRVSLLDASCGTCHAEIHISFRSTRGGLLSRAQTMCKAVKSS